MGDLCASVATSGWEWAIYILDKDHAHGRGRLTAAGAEEWVMGDELSEVLTIKVAERYASLWSHAAAQPGPGAFP